MVIGILVGGVSVVERGKSMSTRFTDFKQFRYFIMRLKCEIDYHYDCIPGVEAFVRDMDGKIICRGYGKDFKEAEVNLMEKWHDR